ncbi:uncharacterized protein [Eurosta solidaginis]|uniref:uncharacterized protein n=1 Tax=Eurosta solidaginis TaxID=178769 RepID=UPI0035317B62
MPEMASNEGSDIIMDKFLKDAWATPPSSPGTSYSELELSPYTHGMRISIENDEEFFNFPTTARAKSDTDNNAAESKKHSNDSIKCDCDIHTSPSNQHLPEIKILEENKNKRRKRNTDNWKREINKKKRMLGEEYIGFRKVQNKIVQDVPRMKRVLNKSICAKACKKSKTFDCKRFSEQQRKHIFANFWKNINWQQKQKYVCSLVHVQNTKATKRSKLKKSNSFAYFLKDGTERRRVCKNMFLSTLGLKAWTVRSWLTNTQVSCSSKKKRNSTKNSKKKLVKNFLASLPKLPSHYCRSTSSKLYLEPVIETKSQLYSLYKNNALELSLPVVSRCYFDNIFSEENISLFKPKKDECNTCIAFKTGNISEAVKLCPKLNASAAYYKTKLAVHNFTAYNLVTKEVVCYWFDETAADLKSSTFANFYMDYISSILRKDVKPVVIYSDGCTYQNRNSVVANALLRLAIEYNVDITQKFLVKGHTQMEVDSVHSVIERKLKNRQIYLPSQYISTTQESRRNPFPYIARELDYTFFKDYDNKEYQLYESIRPGRKKGDKVVFDLRVLKYSSDASINYKLSFESTFLELPHRPKRKWNKNTPHALYLSRIPIQKSKYQHLQELKHVIPSDCHYFYDNLPYKQ